MNRRVLAAAVCFVSLIVLAAPALAQESNTVVTPQQLRRAEPPPPGASAADLERRADELRDEKLYTDSIDYYNAALNRGQKTGDLYNKIGIAQLQLDRNADAKRSFERAIKIRKDFPEPHNNLGVVYYKEKRFKNAINEYKKALALREVSASFHSNLGSAYFARKEYEKANLEYMRAIQIDPNIFDTISRGGISAHLSSPQDRALFDYTMAKIQAKSGNADQSLHYLKKAMEEGYTKIDNVYRDPEFAELRKDKRFAELMSARPAPLPD